MELNLNVEDYASRVGTDVSRELLPEGWYPSTISQVYDEISKAGDSQVVVVFDTDDGTRLWKRYCVHLPAEDKRETARQVFMRLVGACGLVRVGDTSELLGRKCEIKVKIDGKWNNVEDSRSLQRSAPTNGSAPQKVSPWKTEEAAVDKDEPAW